MKHLITEGAPEPDEITSVRRRAVVAALVSRALADGDYLEALVVAAANVIGIRSVTNSVSVEDALGVMRRIAADAVEANTPQVLQ